MIVHMLKASAVFIFEYTRKKNNFLKKQKTFGV